MLWLTEPLIKYNTYMTENIMASVEKFWELIIWVAEIFETIFPEPHVFKGAK